MLSRGPGSSVRGAVASTASFPFFISRSEEVERRPSALASDMQ